MPFDAFLAVFGQPQLLAVFAGALVGFVLALTGAGGGIIAVPLLVFGLNLPMQQAGPIGLLAVALASALGAVLGWRQGILRYRAAGLIGFFGMVVAPLGVMLAQRIPNRWLMLLFSLILLLTAYRMLRHAWRTAQQGGEAGNEIQPCRLNPEDGRLDWTRPCARALAGTGLLSGLLSGLLGVGGGFVIVPALTRYSNLPPQSILVTSQGVIALVAIGTVAAAIWQGGLLWAIALPFTAGALFGLLGGRCLVSRLAGARLQQGFAILCLAVAGLLAARAAGLPI